MMTHLLKLGSEIDSADARGRTPLAVAVAAGQRDAVLLLVDNGASPWKQVSVTIHSLLATPHVRAFWPNTSCTSTALACAPAARPRAQNLSISDEFFLSAHAACSAVCSDFLFFALF